VGDEAEYHMTGEGRGHIQDTEQRAVHVDASTGIREEAGFFGSGRERLFGFTYLPRSTPVEAGIVFCEPILSQFRAHYRVGTLTARALARNGIAVQRFQYRGMGNSDGDITNLTLASMIEDGREATNTLRTVAGVGRTAYFGLNIGAYPAAALSRDGSPLVLDSPHPTGRGYFRAAFRAHGIYAMKEGAEKSATQALLDEMNETGITSLLGCRLPKGLYDSLSSASLPEEMGDESRSVLLIGPGHEGELRADMRRLVDELEGRGLSITVEIRPKEDPFWYVANLAPENRAETGETAMQIAKWVKSQLTVAASTEGHGHG